jgi:hypothetical protein
VVALRPRRRVLDPALHMTARRRAVAVLAGVLTALALFATPAAAADDDPLIETTGLLIEQPGLGPEVCTGAVELSLPPRCRGLPVKGKSFAAVPRSVRVESAGGVRFTDWAIFRGRLHGRTLRLTKVSPITRPKTTPVSERDRPDAACPADGKPGVEPWEAAAFLDETAARYLATYGGGWIDEQGRVTARFTDAPGAYEADLRSRFSASLCVERAPYTLPELEAVQNELIGPELLALGEKYERRMSTAEVNLWRGHVDAYVDLPLPKALVAELRRRFGDRLHVTSAVRVVG